MSAQPCRVDTQPDAHEHHDHRPHLTVVPDPEPARKLCQRCGIRPKKPGKGMRLCEECPPLSGNESRTRGLCIACGESPKERRQGAWYCIECRDLKAEVAAIKRRVRSHRDPCMICGGIKAPGHGNRYCDKCRLTYSHRGAPTMCSGCGDRPIRAPRKRYCQVCADMAKAAERRRNRSRKRKHSTRLEQRESRRQKQLARRRQLYRESRRREKPLTGKLPCAQLADAIARIIEREEAIEPHLILAGRDPYSKVAVERIPAKTMDVCQRAGVSDKSFREWRSGARTKVQFNVADRVLTNLGLLWHDVWTPENTSSKDYAVVREAMG